MQYVVVINCHAVYCTISVINFLLMIGYLICVHFILVIPNNYLVQHTNTKKFFSVHNYLRPLAEFLAFFPFQVFVAHLGNY